MDRTVFVCVCSFIFISKLNNEQWMNEYCENCSPNNNIHCHVNHRIYSVILWDLLLFSDDHKFYVLRFCSVSLILWFASIWFIWFCFLFDRLIFPFYFVANFPLMLLGVDFDIYFHINRHLHTRLASLPTSNFKPNDSERQWLPVKNKENKPEQKRQN